MSKDIASRCQKASETAGELRETLFDAAVEIEKLRIALARIADQDATFSVIGGNIIVDVDPTLTEAERFVLREVRDIYSNEDDVKCNEIAAVLDGLLERLK